VSTAPRTFTFIAATEAPPPPHPKAQQAIAEAMTKLGLPYVWGGEGPDGYDCSGLVMAAWASVGVDLAHQSRAQFAQTARVNLADIAPGDLVFYGDPIHHLGMYIGEGKMIEASKPGTPIRTASIKRRDLVAIGRIKQ
jgi:peptidoglycan DL-endopeptidase CwlO